MQATLAAVQPYTIHGTPYYRIAYAPIDNPEQVKEGRVAAESIYANPAAGDLVEIRLLLGVIDDVSKV